MSAAQDVIRAMNAVSGERARRGLSQEAAGALIGKSQPTVARLENAHLVPEPVLNFFRLASALGLSVRIERAAEVAR